MLRDCAVFRCGDMMDDEDRKKQGYEGTREEERDLEGDRR